MNTRLLTTTAAALLAVSLATLPIANAQDNTIYLGGYGGSFEKLLKEKILPSFESETGAKIVYVPGNSTDTLAKFASAERQSRTGCGIS